MNKRKKIRNTVPDKMIDGKDIKKMCIDLNIKQGYLAKRMGIAPATLSRVTNGKNLLSRPYYILLRYVIRDIEKETKIKCLYEFKDSGYNK
jgi:transcriptional regulator with XRE-family HTH domain